MYFELFLFSLATILGILPCFVYGKCGGDETFCIEHPHLKRILKYIHHWQFGILMIFVGLIISIFTLLDPYIPVFLYGFGLGMSIDDILFHSFEQYFKRKEDE